MSTTKLSRYVIPAIVALTLLAGGASIALAAGLTQSASKVEAVAVYVDSGTQHNTQKIRVQLNIADGWHVNANPASLEFLIPTSIKAKADGKTLPLSITWPDGHNSGIELGGTQIMVYSDGATVPVQLEPAAAQAVAAGQQLTLDVRVQACSNKGMCLPPSTLTIQPLGS